MSGQGPPGRRSRAASHSPAEIVEKTLTNTDAPMVPRQDRHDPEAEWFALFDAECVVELEALALAALHDLSTEQLRSLRWVGLLDDGWRRMFHVFGQRGESL